MKTTKKTFKPVFTVDMTGCDTVEDLIIAIADAKLDAGLCISRKELEAILDEQIEITVEETIEQLFDGHNALIVDENGEIEAFDAIKFTPEPSITCEECIVVQRKKKNVFKRFWSWLTGK